jgi:hypothetical protein
MSQNLVGALELSNLLLKLKLLDPAGLTAETPGV